MRPNIKVKVEFTDGTAVEAELLYDTERTRILRYPECKVPGINKHIKNITPI